MPGNQRDMLMCRKDALFSPDRQKTKPAPQMSARQLRRFQERQTRKDKDKPQKSD